MPTVFFGHGNPLNAISQNAYTEAWARIGNKMPTPKAILAISAHWYIPGAAVTINPTPRTIHDFGGFPPELYKVQYNAPGSPSLARRVQDLLNPLPTASDNQWGLDHGTWSVLCHVFPQANVPIVQLSIDERQPAAFHFDLGQRLAPLREEGVLIVGSGNLVHNLHAYAWGRHNPEPFAWAIEFEKRAREAMTNDRSTLLMEYETLGKDALLSVPTPDHYLPLLYVLGARQKGEAASYPVDGIDGGSVSMLTVKIG